jgi:uncharacterized protein (TIGR00369 family)
MDASPVHDSLVSREWQPRNPAFRDVIRDAFEANKAMSLIGATLGTVEPGVVEIRLPLHDMLMSHIPGIIHGGTLGMIADSALGFAALSLREPGENGVTVEYKINLLAPAVGQEAVARAEVVRPGRKIVVARADVFDLNAGERKLVATALATLIPL